MYRGVIDSNNILIAFGMDEGQSGGYQEIGTWCDFTFESFPEPIANVENKMLYKVANGVVVARTLEEINA